MLSNTFQLTGMRLRHHSFFEMQEGKTWVDQHFMVLNQQIARHHQQGITTQLTYQQKDLHNYFVSRQESHKCSGYNAKRTEYSVYYCMAAEH